MSHSLSSSLSTESLPLLHNVTYIPVVDSYEEVFALYTVANRTEWTHNAAVNQKAALFEVDICDGVNGRQHGLVFQQDRGALGNKGITGSVIWDSSVVLAQFIAQHVEQGLPIRGQSCIELGSGCGVVGMTCARLGANVHLTDQASMLPLLWRNAQRNQLVRNDENATTSTTCQRNSKGKSTTTTTKNRQYDSQQYGTVQVMELAWEDHAHLPVDIRQQTWQYVIASDCVYNEHIVTILVETMKQLARHPATLVLIAQELRSDTVHEAFLEQLLLSFNVWRVVPSIQREYSSNNTPNDDPPCVVVYMARLKC
ncbi:putative methyltransferase-domain-containing protein [Syncephalis plumigaleata]|nr:putative methyltransferase-domain-containing protein [Syncephalis plumigaleata]